MLYLCFRYQININLKNGHMKNHIECFFCCCTTYNINFKMVDFYGFLVLVVYIAFNELCSLKNYLRIDVFFFKYY